MNDTTPDSSNRRSFIPIMLGLLVVLGIFFRFYNIDRKVFWYDEAFSALTLSGFTYGDAYHEVQGKIIPFQDLSKYQKPNQDNGARRVLTGLAVSQPEHAPLAYLVTYFWCKLFNASPQTIRTLPALVSLLQLPAIYWLSMELFGSPLAAGLALALMALSPFAVLFSQEAREYSFFAAVIMFVSIIFLRAIRNQSLVSWGLYFISLLIACYSSVLTAPLIIAHFFYLIFIFGFKWNKTYFAFIVVCFLTLICFSPWIYQVYMHMSTASGPVRWLSVNVPFADLVNTWFDNLSRIFLDLGSEHARLSNCLAAFLLPMEAYAICAMFACERPTSRLILAFLGTVFLCFMLPDLVLGGQRSLYLKFIMLLPVAMVLSVAYLLAEQLKGAGDYSKRFWITVTGYIFIGEIVSCLICSQAVNWYTKGIQHQDLSEVALVLNHDPNCLVVTERGEQSMQTNFMQMLALSHLIKSNAKLELLDEPSIPYVPAAFNHFYLFNPTPWFLQLLASKGYPLSPIGKLPYFWVVATANQSIESQTKTDAP